jgi:hypothetical protein
MKISLIYAERYVDLSLPSAKLFIIDQDGGISLPVLPFQTEKREREEKVGGVAIGTTFNERGGGT